MISRKPGHIIGALLALCLLAPLAQAANVTCYGTKKNTNDRYATLGSASACEGLTEGNLVNTDPLAAFGEDWDVLVKDVFTLEDTATGFHGTANDALLINGSANNPSTTEETPTEGTWSIDLSKIGTDANGNTYNRFVIGIKPDGFSGYWLIDALPNENAIISGEFSDLSNGLSHAGLYGIHVVPLPAAAWLFGSAILGLSVISRRRKAGQGALAA